MGTKPLSRLQGSLGELKLSGELDDQRPSDGRERPGARRCLPYVVVDHDHPGARRAEPAKPHVPRPGLRLLAVLNQRLQVDPRRERVGRTQREQHDLEVTLAQLDSAGGGAQRRGQAGAGPVREGAEATTPPTGKEPAPVDASVERKGCTLIRVESPGRLEVVVGTQRDRDARGDVERLLQPLAGEIERRTEERPVGKLDVAVEMDIAGLVEAIEIEPAPV